MGVGTSGDSEQFAEQKTNKVLPQKGEGCKGGKKGGRKD